MDSNNIHHLTEAYLEIYEANKGEKYLNLTPKEREQARNKRNNPFKSEYGEVHRPEAEVSRTRRFRHSQLRGISPKKQRADIEREYQYSQRNRPEYDDIPRTPAPKPGRRGTLGANSIRRVQPYLDFSRAKAKWKEELKQKEREKLIKDREESKKRTDKEWKNEMAIDDLQRRIQNKKNSPANKIVRLNREEYEYLISYLLDEGYASDIISAEAIYNSMSEDWYDSILNENVSGGRNTRAQADMRGKTKGLNPQLSAADVKSIQTGKPKERVEPEDNSIEAMRRRWKSGKTDSEINKDRANKIKSLRGGIKPDLPALRRSAGRGRTPVTAANNVLNRLRNDPDPKSQARAAHIRRTLQKRSKSTWGTPKANSDMRADFRERRKSGRESFKDEHIRTSKAQADADKKRRELYKNFDHNDELKYM